MFIIGPMVGFVSEIGYKGFHYPSDKSMVILNDVSVTPIRTWLYSDKTLTPCIVPRSVVDEYHLTNSIVWLRNLGESMPKLPIVDQLQRTREAHKTLGKRLELAKMDLAFTEGQLEDLRKINQSLVVENTLLKADLASLKRQIAKLEKPVPKTTRRRSTKKDNDA